MIMRLLNSRGNISIRGSSGCFHRLIANRLLHPFCRSRRVCIELRPHHSFPGRSRILVERGVQMSNSIGSFFLQNHSPCARTDQARCAFDWVIHRKERCVGSTLLEHHLCLSGNSSSDSSASGEELGTNGYGVLGKAILPALVLRPADDLPLVGCIEWLRPRPLLAVTGVTLVLIFLITLREKRSTTIIVLVGFDHRPST